MQRLLSAVVLVSVGALLSAPAFAQTAPTKPAPKPTATAGKPAAPTKPPPAPDTTTKKPDDRLSDEAELARVVGLYESGKYAECSSEMDRLLDPLGKRPLRQAGIVESARVYWAACLIGSGQADAAEVPLRAAIHENPQMKPPDSLVFPQPVVQRFLKVRDSLVSEIKAAEQARIKSAQEEARRREQVLARERSRTSALEKLAQQESVVVRNRRVLAFVPFGVGQLQNRQETLGYTLMASEALLGMLSITAVAVQTRFAVQADEWRRQGRTVPDLNATQATWGTVRDVSFWAFAGLALGGVLQANIEYVPEFKETRSRPLPKELQAPPKPASKPASVSYLPYFDQHGGGLSVLGAF